MADMIENTEAQTQRAENQLRPEHQPPTIVTIREGSADQAECNCRDRAKDAVEPELHRRIGELVEQPVGGGHLHPSADVRNQQAQPKQPKVAIAQRSKTPLVRRCRIRCAAHRSKVVYEPEKGRKSAAS